MATERLEYPLENRINIDTWGFEPIRRLADGSVDYDYYLARGHQARAKTVASVAKSADPRHQALGKL
ncbi:MAG: hypothetical protein R3F37_22530 [Candidatus Competibacteraceae bacterium]